MAINLGVTSEAVLESLEWVEEETKICKPKVHTNELDIKVEETLKDEIEDYDTGMFMTAK